MTEINNEYTLQDAIKELKELIASLEQDVEDTEYYLSEQINYDMSFRPDIGGTVSAKRFELNNAKALLEKLEKEAQQQNATLQVQSQPGM